MKFLSVRLILAFLMLLPGICRADLAVIGTAEFNGSAYNLILDGNNNGNSVIWLDYTNQKASYSEQTAWAGSLDEALENITLNDPSLMISWQDPSWRLPRTIDGRRVKGYDGSTTAGYRVTSSELGHLHTDELGNEGWRTVDGDDYILANVGALDTGVFTNLVQGQYWSGTPNIIEPDAPGLAWYYQTSRGYQDLSDQTSDFFGIALRSGTLVPIPVSEVPVPAAIWLLGSGLLFSAGMVRKS